MSGTMDGPRFLDPTGARQTFANGINGAGSVVGRQLNQAAPTATAFLWRNNTFSDLGTL
jgi:probable HAF family extracellular repeat protein